MAFRVRMAFPFTLSSTRRSCVPELVLNPVWTVITKSDVLAIFARCTQLSLLAIYGNRVEGTLAPIWRSLGSTLTQIYIGYNSPACGYGILDIVSAPDLVEHCVNLYRIDVERLSYEIADVLIALGSRLRVLATAGLSSITCVGVKCI